MFGLDEIMSKSEKRIKTVECVSREGEVLFLSRMDFFHVVNQFKFHELVIDESIQKDRSHIKRMEQTEDFQKVFFNQ